MVVQVYGEIENHQIIFKQNEKGLWETAIPFLESGKYIIRLYAVDEAGNESYCATAIYTIDTEKIAATLEIIEYAANIEKLYETNTKITDYAVKAEELFDANITLNDYGANVLTFEVIHDEQ